MKNKNVFFVLIFGVLLTLVMCKKDEDNPPPYVGEWETETFEMQGMNVKMDFVFTETNFTSETSTTVQGIQIGVLGLKGDITEKPNQVLGTSLTDLGLPSATGGYDYKNRYDDAAEFEGLYQQMGLAAMIPKDFDAPYEVDGDQLNFIITELQDTINLHRK